MQGPAVALRGLAGEIEAHPHVALLGPAGIVIADALLGEISPAMAAAVGRSPAKKILIPMNQCDILVAGVEDLPVSRLLDRAVELLSRLMECDT